MIPNLPSHTKNPPSTTHNPPFIQHLKKHTSNLPKINLLHTPPYAYKKNQTTLNPTINP